MCVYFLSKEAAAVSTTMNQSKGVLMVDCGHGGMDPGMIGINGVQEKDFNLSIGLKLKTELEKNGYQVVTTREKDDGLYDETSVK